MASLAQNKSRQRPLRSVNLNGGSVIHERDIQASICGLLEWLQVMYSVTDASRVYAKDGTVRRSKVRTGWPDVTMVLPGGRAAFFELKDAKGRVSPEQAATITRLRAAGAWVDVVRSLDDAVFCLRLWLPPGSDAAERLERLHL